MNRKPQQCQDRRLDLHQGVEDSFCKVVIFKIDFKGQEENFQRLMKVIPGYGNSKLRDTEIC
jgi:hypothetical protein